MMIIPYFVINTKHTWMHFIFDLNLIHCQVLDLGKRRATCCTEKKRNENNSIHVFIRNAFPGFTLIGSAHINIFQSPENETVNPLRPSEIIPVIGGVRTAHTLVFEVAF